MENDIPTDEVHDRIKRRLEKVGMSAHAASVAAGLDKSYLRKLFARPGGRPNLETARKLGAVLNMSFEDLVAPSDLGGPAEAPPHEPIRISDGLPPVPVRGTVAGSHESGAFQFDGSDVDYIDRYPALASRPRVYALYVEGDSMFPEHKQGAIRFVDPSQPVRIGDTVVVTVNDIDRGLFAVLGNLLGRGEEVVLGKLNPSREIRFNRLLVHSIHHVLTDNELAGRVG